MNSSDIKLILVAPDEKLCDAWKQEFYEVKSVSVVNGYFEELTEYDCMVSAGNSFGLMDGGVDLAIIKYFGLELMSSVQEYIINNFRGEQPVGTSFIISTGNPQHPFLAHAPTMRVPMEIATTDNPYLAMWAMLLSVWRHNQREEKKINIVACPGLGTGTGCVPFAKAAKQMKLAYNNFLYPPKDISWPYAITRQNAIGAGGDVKNS